MLPFPPPLESYGDASIAGIGAKLAHRIAVEPFNLVGSLLFIAAIVHTFLVAKFRHVGHAAEHELAALEESDTERDATFHRRTDRLRFRATLFHFLGEVEAVFGIWLVPLLIALTVMKSFKAAIHYIDGVNYTEPIFVTVIMAMAATRPVFVFAETCLSRIANLFGGKATAWWFVILSVGPLLGSFITEPAAMTLCAMLLAERFYTQNPSMKLRYATLGLLFVNVSVGGTLTHFAAPPVVMVATKWGYDLKHMVMHFGDHALIGMLASNTVYWFIFRRELAALPSQGEVDRGRSVPLRITLVHLLFLAWTVLNAHHPSVVVISSLFFIAYLAATQPHQEKLALRGPLLVGFFLAGLVVHGGLQSWWIEPVLSSLGEWPMMIGSTILTSFNDNAAITYLASLVPGLTPELKHAVLVGAVTGGGLTVIANAPNPAGQSILQKYFGEDGISPGKLFLAALAPTIIVGAAFMLI